MANDSYMAAFDRAIAMVDRLIEKAKQDQNFGLRLATALDTFNFKKGDKNAERQ